jgi:hypothetical protein
MSLVSYTEREMGGKSAVRAKDVHAAVTWEVPHAGGQVHPGKIRHDCRTKPLDLIPQRLEGSCLAGDRATGHTKVSLRAASRATLAPFIRRSARARPTWSDPSQRPIARVGPGVASHRRSQSVRRPFRAKRDPRNGHRSFCPALPCPQNAIVSRIADGPAR